MSFGFNNQAPAFGSAPAGAPEKPQLSVGPALEEITTEKLGFLALAGDTKVQLFPTAWPSDATPPSWSSLLSINSRKGLLAAASPDSLVIATTSSVREAFSNDVAATDNAKPFTPQLTIPMQTRISQLAFSSDGTYLVISAEAGGGLAVYETEALLSGSTKSAFELATNQASVMNLVPNPDPSSAHLFAVVTSNGDLCIADMKAKGFTDQTGGKILRQGVSCVSWSARGKQLIAGLGNATVVQMKPSGETTGEILRPADLEGDQHVSSAFWLENDLFLLVFTPSVTTEDGPPASNYRLISRQPGTQNCVAQVLPEVCSPFGLNRQPSFQFMQRLRNFSPHLTDMIMVASTTSEDIGLYTRASKQLSADAGGHTDNTFTMTSLADDSRRAAVPMASNMADMTSAIGMALDLSSTSTVSRPIPGDDIDNSPGPLPALFLLNHLGILSGWWVVYNDSIRQGTSYLQLIAVGGEQPAQTRQQTPATSFGTNPVQSSVPAFGATSILNSNPSAAFGTANKPTSAFGTSSFGSQGMSGNRASPWGGASSTAASTAPAFGQPSFGQPSFGSSTSIGANTAPAFGAASNLGQKQSLWGSSSQSTTQSGGAFGQSTFGSAPASSGSSANALGGGSGFASFASGGGFAAAAANAPKAGENIFKQGSSSFGTVKPPESSFGSGSQASSGGLFGSSTGGFSLGSSWTNANAGKDTESAASQDTSSALGSGFSSVFASALSQANTEGPAASKEEEMTDDQEPPANSAASKQDSADTSGRGTSSSGLFDAKPSSAVFSSAASGGNLFAKSAASLPPNPFAAKTQAPSLTSAAESTGPGVVSIKKEPEEDTPKVDRSVPEAPLPPDPTSKASYTPGNSSSSSASISNPILEEPPLQSTFFGKATKPGQVEDAPLPPDFTKKVANTPLPSKAPEDAPLPPDFMKKATEDPVPSKEPEDAPLPPDFVSKPVPAQPKTVAKALPPDSVTSAEIVQPDGGDSPSSDLSELDEEGSGVDVAREIDRPEEQGADTSPVSPPNPKTGTLSIANSFQKMGPSRETSRTLFGEISEDSVPNLGPPRRDPGSPRSPSPVRAAQSTSRADVSRSVSGPSVPLRTDSARKVTLGRDAATRAKYPPLFEPVTTTEEQKRVSQLRVQPTAPPPEEDQELIDHLDEQVRTYLAQDASPALDLDPFLASQNTTYGVLKQGIPGQVEKVYRDINSMVDTLGMNAKALESFIRGHQELYPAQGRTRDDLNHHEAWTLSEIETLVEYQQEIENDLVSEDFEDKSVMLHSCDAMAKELSRLKARQADFKQTLEANLHPEHIEALRATPLSAEQSSMRYDLRAKHTELQRTLAQCEEAVSMLKAKSASLSIAKTNADGSPAVPTAEAVERTILKMTSMFEKRSGDIDVLESQMRQLQLTPGLSDSREDSPFMTPPANRTRGLDQSPASSINGRSSFHTPGSRRSGLGASIMSGQTPSRLGRSPGKKLAEIDENLAREWAAKAQRKRNVRVMLKEALIAGNTRIRPLDEG